MKLSSTPASKVTTQVSPVDGHMEPEGSSISKGPIIQPDLQARNNLSRVFLYTVIESAFDSSGG